jgi:hypothetical protein
MGIKSVGAAAEPKDHSSTGAISILPVRLQALLRRTQEEKPKREERRTERAKGRAERRDAEIVDLVFLLLLLLLLLLLVVVVVIVHCVFLPWKIPGNRFLAKPPPVSGFPGEIFIGKPLQWPPPGFPFPKGETSLPDERFPGASSRSPIGKVSETRVSLESRSGKFRKLGFCFNPDLQFSPGLSVRKTARRTELRWRYSGQKLTLENLVERYGNRFTS